MSQESQPTSSASVSDQASAWFARLQADDVSADERQCFQAWYRAHPQHAEAYEKTRKLWSLLKIPAENVQNRIQAEAQSQSQIRGTEQRDANVRPHSRSSRHWATIGCLSLLLIFAGWRLPGQWQNWRSDYHTAAGQQLSVALEDGSRLTLNTDTALAVRFSEQQRRIELLRGEAYFDVAPNKARPFIVDGGDAEARAVGTAFSVRKEPDAIRVAVSEGTVKVSADSTYTVVDATQQVDVQHKQIQPVLNTTNDDAFAWQRGQVVFSRQPLNQVLAEVNRYRGGRIVAIDPALAERIISGVFNVGDADAVVDALQATLHAQAVQIPGGLVLLY